MWFDLVGDISFVDKVRLTGPSKDNIKKTDHEFTDSIKMKPITIPYIYP